MMSQNSNVALRSTAEAPAPFIDWSGFEPPRMPLRDIWRTLARRGRLIVTILIILNVFAAVVVSRVSPRYTAEADVMISPRQEQVVDLKAVLAGLSGDTDVVESETQLLRSRGIARSVVEKLNLDKLAEFNTMLAAPGLGNRVSAWLRTQFALAAELLPPAAVPYLTFLSRGTPPVAAETPVDPLAASVDAFLRHLGVAPRGHSRVISVTFDSANPTLAASAANAVVDAYIAGQLKAKQDATSSAQRWLTERVLELRRQMQSADAAVQDYRQRAGLTSAKGGSFIAEQITDIGQQIIQAKTQQAEVDARLRAATGGHLRAQGLEQASEAARDRVQTLEALFEKLRAQSDSGDQSEVGLHVLEHEADADRALYDRLLLRLKETSIESGLQLPDAQIVSRAEPPADPTFPRIPIILGVVLVASCVFAGLIAMLLESLERGYTSAEQVERQLGIPVLGVVPALRRGLRGARKPETYVLDKPGSAFGETIRGLYTSLLLSPGARPAKIVLITSALPREGKSSTALALGRMVAACGKRVAIIDCDLHRGRLRKSCGLTSDIGLMDLLDGRVSVDQVIHRDALSPANIIPTGATRHVSPDLIGSERMRAALAVLAECYDLVLLDSAPLLAVSDTRNLCRLADRTVMVVRWKDTKQSAAAAAMRQIIEGGGQIAGTLFTMVDVRRYARYSDRNLYQGNIGQYVLE